MAPSLQEEGDTPLIIAVREDKLDMVDWLLSKGAKVGARNKVRAPLFENNSAA